MRNIENNVEDFIAKLIIDNIMFFRSFYQIKLDNSEIAHKNYDIVNSFNELSLLFKEMSSVKWWNLFKVNALTKKGKDKISNLHIKLVEQETRILETDIRRDKFLDDLVKSPLMNNVSTYFKDEIKNGTKISSNLLKAVEYYSNEIREFGNTRAMAVSTIFGALIGAIIAAIVTIVTK